MLNVEDRIRELEAEIAALQHRLNSETVLREQAEASASHAIGRGAVAVSDAWESAERIARTHPEKSGAEVAELIRRAALLER